MERVSTGRRPPRRPVLCVRSAFVLDLLAGGAQRVPLGAEVVQALAVGLSRLRIADVPVRRVACVGDLLAAVRAPGGSQQPLLDATPCDRPAVRQQRWPVGGARSGAGAPMTLVLLEQVERPASAVDDDATEARAAGADPGRLRAARR